MSIQLLIDSLWRMDELHVELLELADQKKQALLERNYEGLVGTLSRESKLVRAIEEHEKELLSAAHAFLKSKGIKSQLELTISEILRLVFDPEEKRVMNAARESLGKHLMELKRANELNQEVIKQSLSFIDFSMNLMIGGEDDNATYAPPKDQEKRASSRSLFDTRA